MESNLRKGVEAIAARARVSVQQELSRAFGNADLNRLADIVEKLDSLLTISLDSLFRDHPEALAPGCIYLSKTMHFVLDREHFDLRISQAILEPYILEIALLSIERVVGPDGYLVQTAKLTESGQYRQVRISVPRGTGLSLTSIALLAEAVYGTGCRWLEEAVKDVASKEIAGVGHDLYRMIRELLPDSSLVANLWLVAFAGQRGCYLLDREPTDQAIAKLSMGMIGASASPLSLATKLFTTVLSYANSHSRYAVEGCVDVSLDKSDYLDTNTLFLEAEKVIFGSSDVSIFPILATDSGQVFAVFPTRHRAVLEPFLELNKAAICERFLLSRSHFKHLLASLTQPRQAPSYGKAGEFLGGIFKAAFMEP